MITQGQELNAQVDAGNECRWRRITNREIATVGLRANRRAPDCASQAMYGRMIAKARTGRKEQEREQKEESNPFSGKPLASEGKKVNEVGIMTGKSTLVTVDKRKRKKVG